MSGNARDGIEKLMRHVLRSRVVQKIVREAIVHIPNTYSPYQQRAQSYVVMKQAPASQ